MQTMDNIDTDNVATADTENTSADSQDIEQPQVEPEAVEQTEEEKRWKYQRTDFPYSDISINRIKTLGKFFPQTPRTSPFRNQRALRLVFHLAVAYVI